MNREEIVNILTSRTEQIVKPYFDSREEIIREVREKQSQNNIRLEQIKIERNRLRLGLERLRDNKEKEIEKYLRIVSSSTNNLRERLEKAYETRERDYQEQIRMLDEEEQKLRNVNYSNLIYEKKLPGKKETSLAQLGKLKEEIRNQIERKEIEIKLVDLDINSVRNQFYSWNIGPELQGRLAPYYNQKQLILKQIEQLKELLEKVKEYQSIIFKDEELNNYINGMLNLNDYEINTEEIETTMGEEEKKPEETEITVEEEEKEPEEIEITVEEEEKEPEETEITVEEEEKKEPEETEITVEEEEKEPEETEITMEEEEKEPEIVYPKIKRDFKLVPKYETLTISDMTTEEIELIESYEEKLINQIYELLNEAPNNYNNYSIEIAKLKYENEIDLLRKRIEFKENLTISKGQYIDYWLNLSALKFKLSRTEKKLENLNKYMLDHNVKIERNNNSRLNRAYTRIDIQEEKIMDLDKKINDIEYSLEVEKEKRKEKQSNLFVIKNLEIKKANALERKAAVVEKRDKKIEKRDVVANKMVLHRNGIVRGAQFIVAYNITKNKIHNFVDNIKEQIENNIEEKGKSK